MRVSEVMTKNPAEVTSDAFIVEAAKKMKEHDTGFIPVVDSSNQNKLVGVITDRDIAIRAVAEGVDVHNAKVSSYMTRNNLVSVAPDTDLSRAAAIMADRQVHRLCVVDNDRMVGVVSLGDLAVTDEEEGGEALEGISHGAKAEGRSPTAGERARPNP